jgi:hypothetical protein
MSFVKLDDGILDSSLWVDGDSTRLFLAALLLARPQEFTEPIEQISVRGFDKTGFVAPPGWYGFIPASGSGLIRRALLDSDQGLKALEKLCSADDESRSCEFEGRRLARVPDGYVILNFMKYRDKDHTAAERQRRLRDRNRERDSVTDITRDKRDVTRDVTQSESESESLKTKTKPSAERDKSLPAVASLPTLIAIPLNDGTEHGITARDVEEFRSLYPAVDVMQELRNMRGWSLANQSNRKTKKGVMRFIAGWLSNQQNRAPRQGNHNGTYGNTRSYTGNRAQDRTNGNIAAAQAAIADILNPDVGSFSGGETSSHE